jgi:hypothetical protein
MFKNATALLAVLALAVPAFYISGQIARPFMSARELAVWRNTWFAVTVAAFLTGNFFVFALVVVIICIYARSAGAATVGLCFVLLFAAPPAITLVSGFGFVNQLLPLSNGRVLSIALLLPTLVATARSDGRKTRAYTAPDVLVISYVLLLIALEFRRSDLTNVMRVAVGYALDVLIPYLAFSRTVRSVLDFQKALLGFVVAVLPLSLISVLEFIKSWHIYGGIATDWGEPISYLRREGLLRAAGPTGGGIALGFVLMVAVGCALPFWHRINPSRRFVAVALAIFSAGSVAALSRGPWLGTAVLVTAYLAVGARPVENLGKLLTIGLIVVVPLLLSPAGDSIIKFLPFVGSVEEGTVTYRQQLFDASLSVIEHDLWFGSTEFLSSPELKALMQGEGIIDLVNTYIEVALKSGLVGLSLFVAFFAAILMGLRPFLKDIHLSEFAGASVAILLAILFTIATVSSVDFIPWIYWSFAGLSVALIRIGYRQRAAATGLRYAGNVSGRSAFAQDRTPLMARKFRNRFR